MAARYKSRAIAQYAPERIPELSAAVAGRSHAGSAQGAWSDWVTDLPGRLHKLTPASMLMPLVAQLPPPDMRLPPKPIRRLDPAAVRHFHLQDVRVLAHCDPVAVPVLELHVVERVNYMQWTVHCM